MRRVREIDGYMARADAMRYLGTDKGDIRKIADLAGFRRMVVPCATGDRVTHYYLREDVEKYKAERDREKAEIDTDLALSEQIEMRIVELLSGGQMIGGVVIDALIRDHGGIDDDDMLRFAMAAARKIGVVRKDGWWSLPAHLVPEQEPEQKKWSLGTEIDEVVAEDDAGPEPEPQTAPEPPPPPPAEPRPQPKQDAPITIGEERLAYMISYAKQKNVRMIQWVWFEADGGSQMRVRIDAKSGAVVVTPKDVSGFVAYIDAIGDK